MEWLRFTAISLSLPGTATPSTIILPGGGADDAGDDDPLLFILMLPPLPMGDDIAIDTSAI